jgi:hypothetical protein
LGKDKRFPDRPFRRHEGIGGPRAYARFFRTTQWRQDQYGKTRHYGSRFGAYAGVQRLTGGSKSGEHQQGATYSRAFENFVSENGEEEDVVGLVAYALFKKAVREEVASGASRQSDKRNPSETTVRTYRAAAEQLITNVVGLAIEEATPEIQNSAVLAAIENSQVKLETHVTKRTGFASALIANVAAWAITLAIAAIILFLAARPSVEQAIVEAAKTPSASQVATPKGPAQ